MSHVFFQITHMQKQPVVKEKISNRAFMLEFNDKSKIIKKTISD